MTVGKKTHAPRKRARGKPTTAKASPPPRAPSAERKRGGERVSGDIETKNTGTSDIAIRPDEQRAAARAEKDHARQASKERREKLQRVRDAFIGALDALGGKAFVLEFAKRFPKDFLQLLTKFIPTSVTHTLDEAPQKAVKFVMHLHAGAGVTNGTGPKTIDSVSSMQDYAKKFLPSYEDWNEQRRAAGGDGGADAAGDDGEPGSGGLPPVDEVILNGRQLGERSPAVHGAGSAPIPDSDGEPSGEPVGGAEPEPATWLSIADDALAQRAARGAPETGEPKTPESPVVGRSGDGGSSDTSGGIDERHGAETADDSDDGTDEALSEVQWPDKDDQRDGDPPIAARRRVPEAKPRPAYWAEGAPWNG